MSAAGSIWMPLYPRDYIADTQGLDAEQSGAYLHLLMHSWTVDRPLPDDDTELANISRVPVRRWRTIVRAKVIGFFYRVAGGFRQKRLEVEREKARKKSEKALIGGTARGLQAQQNQRQTRKVASAKLQPEASPLPVPSPVEIQEESKKAIPVASLPRPQRADKQEPKTAPPVLELVPDEPAAQPQLLVDRWNAFAREHGLETVRLITDDRRKRLMALWKRHGIEGFRDALDQIPKSTFLLGKSQRGTWRVNLDYLLRLDAFQRVLEGQHTDGAGAVKETMASAYLAAMGGVPADYGDDGRVPSNSSFSQRIEPRRLVRA